MTFIQNLVTSLLPKEWSAAIQAESESWLLACSVCGSVRSVWEVGGVRFKAASVGKRVMVRCAQCGQLRLMSMQRKATGR
jgi:uncharacterized Zn finger protein